MFCVTAMQNVKQIVFKVKDFIHNKFQYVNVYSIISRRKRLVSFFKLKGKYTRHIRNHEDWNNKGNKSVV